MRFAPDSTSFRGLRDPDNVASARSFNDLSNLLTVIRWGTFLVSVFVAASQKGLGTKQIVCACVLAVYTLFRTFRPLRYGRMRGLLFATIAFELVLTTAIVVVTGLWNSPFAGVLLFPVIAAGFAGAWIGAAAGAAFVSISIGLAWWLTDATKRVTCLNWTIELLLVAALSAYARRIFFNAQERTSIALHRINQLSQANSLLFELNQVAQSLPASLDLEETINTTVAHLKELVHSDKVILLLLDDATSSWIVAANSGGRLEGRYATHELPLELQVSQSAGSHNPHIEDRGLFFEQSQSAMWVDLVSRDVLIGFLLLESAQETAFDLQDSEILVGFAEQAALAIDNARWFERLKFVGADQERSRIARELHDRVGQSLAYIGLELDRLAKDIDGDESRTKIEILRDDVRKATSEVRETLYDLRSDVSENRDIVALMQEFAERVQQRSPIEVTVSFEIHDRLPILQEREMWHIAQEAVINAERHAQCKSITLYWYCSPNHAELRVVDDGVGFVPAQAGRVDSYGMTGMRERAGAIGARLEITSTHGTQIACKLERI